MITKRQRLKNYMLPLPSNIVPSYSGIYGLKDQPYTEILDKHFFELAPKSLLYDDTCFEELKYNVTKKIREFYLANKKIDESTRWNLLDVG